VQLQLISSITLIPSRELNEPINLVWCSSVMHRH